MGVDDLLGDGGGQDAFVAVSLDGGEEHASQEDVLLFALGLDFIIPVLCEGGCGIRIFAVVGLVFLP